MIGVVIGNGESRKDFDLRSMPLSVITYGCNALYRDYKPDVLVAVDESMIKEIKDSGYTGNLVYRQDNKLISTFKYLDADEFYDTGASSGPVAVHLMCLFERTPVICLIGFDFFGTIDAKHNNIYKGTPNYRGADEPLTPSEGWIKQMVTVITYNPDISFYFVHADEYLIPLQLSLLTNVKKINYNVFRRLLGIW